MRDPSPIARYTLPFHRGEEPLHWWLTRVVVYPLAVWGFRFRAFGVEQVPRRGRVILAANHYSNWDPIWIAFPLPRASFFFASEGLFHHPRWGAPLRLLITAYQALPADPRRPAAALKRARRVLEAEKALVIFPEGERNFTENLLLPFQSGTALLASWTQAPVVPVYIHRGVQQGPRAWLTGKAPLAVFYGPPLSPPRNPDREMLNAWTRELQKNVEDLAREALARYPLSGEEGDQRSSPIPPKRSR